MNAAQTNSYEDRDRPNGVGSPNAPAPVWFDAAMQRVTQAIMATMQFHQHEYLEHKKLPHMLKPGDALTVPHILPDGDVLVTTVFPVASDHCYVAYFSPSFRSGLDAMRSHEAAADDEVVDYLLFVYQETGLFAVHNVPQVPADFIAQELKRQAKAINLRAPQFLYFTKLTPRTRDGYDDPNGYLAKLTASRNTVAASAAESGRKTGPTPVQE